MELVCHRCSATVEPDAFYCQNCGAPLIRYVPQEENAESTADNKAATTAPSVDRADFIHWKMTIRISATVAIGVGILSTLLAVGSVLWVAAGAVIVIGI